MTREKYQGLEQLVIWRRSIEFAEKICQEVLPLLPAEEKFGMSSQLRRASQSIPANIAEGYGRYYYQEGIRFSYLARGSLEEVFTHLTIAYRLNYISQYFFSSLLSDIEDIRKLMHGYIAYLKRSKRGEAEPGNIYQIKEPFNPYLSELETDQQDGHG